MTTIEDDNIWLLLKALHFAAQKHKDQRRKDPAASPYINHPIEVAETLWRIGGVRDMTTLVAAVLHDTIEDTETTPQELEAEFGPEVRTVVEEVTDDKHLSWQDRKRLQIERAKHKSPQAKLVKLADKICNVQDIAKAPPAGWSPERQRKYIDWARAVVDEVRGANPDLERHFDTVYAAAAEVTDIV